MGVSGKLETRWWRTSWWEKVTVEGGAQGEGIKQVDRILTVLGQLAVVPFEMLVTLLYFHDGGWVCFVED